MKNKILLVIGAVGAVVLGLVYVFRAFGPTEAEVVLWGWVSAGLGIVLGLLVLAIKLEHAKFGRVILGAGYALLAALQIPPIVLWFAATGSGITDGTPPSPFVAHWAYAIPHLVLLLVGGACLYAILRRTPSPERRKK